MAEEQPLKVHVPDNLEYVYRDLFNIYIGMEEVVIEFGNRRRDRQNEADMSNRIVLSVSAAYNLQQALNQALTEMSSQLQQSMAEGA
ncbi:MAG: hypothetical protein PWQ57_2726 [Desulfovibrionales bacterium]|jgi:hypothetical protein|nr:hypothetical protein [Desulfovibrionales bacterium]